MILGDYMWLVDAAGDDQRRLAQVALFLTAHTMMLTSQVDTERPEVLEDFYNVTLAMDEIAKKIGRPPSEVTAEFRERYRQERGI